MTVTTMSSNAGDGASTTRSSRRCAPGDACASSRESSCHSLGRGGDELARFRAELCNRAGNDAKAWRSFIDPRSKGRISKQDFFSAMRESGMASRNLQSLWAELDATKIGLITMSEWDWSAAELLGRFHRKLTSVFGDISTAADALELKDMRHLSEEDFLTALHANRVANAEQAALLFQFLKGSLKGENRQAVTRDDLVWLGAISAHLPHAGGGVRVRPGGDDARSDDLFDERFNEEPEQRAMRFRSRPGEAFVSFDSPKNKIISTCSTELITSPSSLMSFQSGMSVHEKLYLDGLSHIQRLNSTEANTKARTWQAPPSPADPELFERLHSYGEILQEKRRCIVGLSAQPQDERRCVNKDGLVYHDEETFKRLTERKEKVAPPPLPPCSQPWKVAEDPSHPCVRMYDEHMQKRWEKAEARKSAEELAEKELQEKAENEASRRRGPDPFVIQRLYDCHAQSQLRLAEKRSLKEEEEAEAAAAATKGVSSSCPRGGTRPETFYRLYMDGRQRESQLSMKRAQALYEEDVKLRECSVHNRVRAPCDSSARNSTGVVFERLYRTPTQGQALANPFPGANAQMPTRSKEPPRSRCASILDTLLNPGLTEEVFAQLGLEYERSREEYEEPAEAWPPSMPSVMDGNSVIDEYFEEQPSVLRPISLANRNGNRSNKFISISSISTRASKVGAMPSSSSTPRQQSSLLGGQSSRSSNPKWESVLSEDVIKNIISAVELPEEEEVPGFVPMAAQAAFEAAMKLSKIVANEKPPGMNSKVGAISKSKLRRSIAARVI